MEHHNPLSQPGREAKPFLSTHTHITLKRDATYANIYVHISNDFLKHNFLTLL